jgi:hypothetical protein
MSRTTSGSAPTDQSEESFLSRFSRLKHEARESGISQAPGSDVDASPLELEGAAVEAPPALTDADMPDLSTLDAESDYTGFLSEKVSDSLRRAALRKLFHSSAFNVIDELDDYNEDFTTFEALGDLVTAEMKHREWLEQQKAATPVAGEQTEQLEAQDTQPSVTADSDATGMHPVEPVTIHDGEEEIAETPDHREDDDPDRSDA